MNIEALLREAVARHEDHNRSTVERVVWSETGVSARQMLARAVVLDDRESARARGESMAAGKKGEDDVIRVEPESTDSELRSKERVDRIKDILARGRAVDYEQARDELSELGQLTRTEIAARLAVALNARLRALPQDTHDQRKAIASWVNGELRSQFLAIRDPESNRPAIVAANKAGRLGTISAYRFRVRDERGELKWTWSGKVLRDLELMPDEARLEPIVGWAGRISKGGGRESPGG